MHFTISYDIHGNVGTVNSIEGMITNVLRGYSWVRPLTMTYVVRVDNQIQWDSIKRQLADIAVNNQGAFYFIMSPMMIGGHYDGWLNNDIWNEINVRTT